MQDVTGLAQSPQWTKSQHARIIDADVRYVRHIPHQGMLARHDERDFVPALEDVTRLAVESIAENVSRLEKKRGETRAIPAPFLLRREKWMRAAAALAARRSNERA